MGEIVRLILVKLAKDKMLFDGDYEAISKPNCFPTKYVSDIEESEFPILFLFDIIYHLNQSLQKIRN